MANYIVGKSLEWCLRMIPPHPHVERIVQKEIGKQGADYSSLWRPFLPAAQRAIYHLNRRFQPPFNVEDYPVTFGMFPHRPHQELMVNIIEKALDVEVKHPVESPAPLPCNTDSFLC